MSEEKDKVKGMSYKHKDPETGEEKIYEISYSQVLQKKIDDHLIEVNNEIKKSNRLKLILLTIFAVVVIIGLLLIFETGTVGYYLRRMVCPGMI